MSYIKVTTTAGDFRGSGIDEFNNPEFDEEMRRFFNNPAYLTIKTDGGSIYFNPQHVVAVQLVKELK